MSNRTSLSGDCFEVLDGREGTLDQAQHRLTLDDPGRGNSRELHRCTNSSREFLFSALIRRMKISFVTKLITTDVCACWDLICQSFFFFSGQNDLILVWFVVFNDRQYSHRFFICSIGSRHVRCYSSLSSLLKQRRITPLWIRRWVYRWDSSVSIAVDPITGIRTCPW